MNVLSAFFFCCFSVLKVLYEDRGLAREMNSAIVVGKETCAGMRLTNSGEVLFSRKAVSEHS